MENKLTQLQDELCTPTSRPILESDLAQAGAVLFAALADPTRLAILSLLMDSPDEEVCVCDITASFKVSQPTISYHLKTLRDAELIHGDKRGRWVYYSIVPSQREQMQTIFERVLCVPVLT